jgi:hypothetical protein
MHASISSAAVAATALACTMLAGCSDISQMTRQRVAGSETAVNQAQETIGRSEAGAVELQRAKENLNQAKRAIDAKDQQKAERYATEAQLDAELAVAKSQSSSARKAADELLASIQQLRQETQRSTDAAR